MAEKWMRAVVHFWSLSRYRSSWRMMIQIKHWADMNDDSRTILRDMCQALRPIIKSKWNGPNLRRFITFLHAKVKWVSFYKIGTFAIKRTNEQHQQISWIFIWIKFYVRWKTRDDERKKRRKAARAKKNANTRIQEICTCVKMRAALRRINHQCRRCRRNFPSVS